MAVVAKTEARGRTAALAEQAAAVGTSSSKLLLEAHHLTSYVRSS